MKSGGLYYHTAATRYLLKSKCMMYTLRPLARHHRVSRARSGLSSHCTMCPRVVGGPGRAAPKTPTAPPPPPSPLRRVARGRAPHLDGDGRDERRRDRQRRVVAVAVPSRRSYFRAPSLQEFQCRSVEEHREADDVTVGGLLGVARRLVERQPANSGAHARRVNGGLWHDGWVRAAYIPISVIWQRWRPRTLSTNVWRPMTGMFIVPT